MYWIQTFPCSPCKILSAILFAHHHHSGATWGLYHSSFLHVAQLLGSLYESPCQPSLFLLFPCHLGWMLHDGHWWSPAILVFASYPAVWVCWWGSVHSFFLQSVTDCTLLMVGSSSCSPVDSSRVQSFSINNRPSLVWGHVHNETHFLYLRSRPDILCRLPQNLIVGTCLSQNSW